jgi:hypothetical protein
MLGALRRAREPTVVELLEAAAAMMAEIDPGGTRDHSARWRAAVAARRTRPDIFERVVIAADELASLGVQMVRCDPYADAGVEGCLSLFESLVEAEGHTLATLERDTPAVQLMRRWYPDLRAAKLPVSVKAMRGHHDTALALHGLLARLAA